jgi:nucleoside phosphorylase
MAAIPGIRMRVAVFCVEEMGMASAASVTSQLIDQLRPKMLVMLGMCCGFQQEQCQNRSALGDVIVVREAACWDEGKYGELAKGTFFFNRARNLHIEKPLDHLISSLLESDSEQLANAMKNTWNDRRSISLRKKFKPDVCNFPDIKYGLLLSGSSVVANDVKGDEIITRFPNALGLEMEVFGVYKAVDRAVGAKPIVLAVKGVADFGNGEKHSEFQSLASRLSYCVAHEIIRTCFAKLGDGSCITSVVDPKREREALR